MSSKNQKNKKKFAKYLIKLDHNLNAYFRPSYKTSHVCVVIHEHLGLIQNLVQTVQNIVGNKISIFIPDLFSTVTSKSLLNNQFDALQKLTFSRVKEAIQKSLNYLQKNHSAIFLLAFSVGAAYGWKILQRIHKFEFACLFYGFPDIKSINPQKIKTKTYIFAGSNDKIKYLSDEETFEMVAEKSKTSKFLAFQKLNGVGHGFLNPDCQNFSEGALSYCQKIMFTQLPKNLVDHNDKKVKVEEEKKQDDSSCSIC